MVFIKDFKVSSKKMKVPGHLGCTWQQHFTEQFESAQSSLSPGPTPAFRKHSPHACTAASSKQCGKSGVHGTEKVLPCESLVFQRQRGRSRVSRRARCLEETYLYVTCKDRSVRPLDCLLEPLNCFRSCLRGGHVLSLQVVSTLGPFARPFTQVRMLRVRPPGPWALRGLVTAQAPCLSADPQASGPGSQPLVLPALTSAGPLGDSDILRTSCCLTSLFPSL